MNGWKRAAAGIVILSVLTGGCEFRKETDGKEGYTEVAYTILEEQMIPEELLGEIDRNRAGEIRMAYRDGGEMYLIRGYGEQSTGGYSIQIVECLENEDEIYLDTRLLGPSGQEQATAAPSYPYIVLKIDAREKEVKIQ